MPLTEACGRVSAAPVAALLVQPACRCFVNGWLCGTGGRPSGGGVSLACIGNAPAGHPFPGRVGAGQCVRLFTGSLMPAGTDAVLIQENAQADGTAVTTTDTLRPGTTCAARARISRRVRSSSRRAKAVGAGRGGCGRRQPCVACGHASPTRGHCRDRR
ncbi:hypothetical protein RAA17_17170 [Komagataeibacter rhaeticus]|nr:hypothetical protein [Komagataeibacter rhaeticus]